MASRALRCRGRLRIGDLAREAVAFLRPSWKVKRAGRAVRGLRLPSALAGAFGSGQLGEARTAPAHFDAFAGTPDGVNIPGCLLNDCRRAAHAILQCNGAISMLLRDRASRISKDCSGGGKVCRVSTPAS